MGLWPLIPFAAAGGTSWRKTCKPHLPESVGTPGSTKEEVVNDKKKLTHNPFVCLNNMFVNGRGQLADNLDTSRSLVAVMVRETRQLEREGWESKEQKAAWQLELKLDQLVSELKAKIRERDEVLKVAVRMPKSEGCLRTNQFRKANRLAREIKEIKKEIVMLKKGEEN